MMNAVESGGLDGGVVDHILEDDFISDGKRMGERPCAHEVTTKAGIAAKAIGEWSAPRTTGI